MDIKEKDKHFSPLKTHSSKSHASKNGGTCFTPFSVAVNPVALCVKYKGQRGDSDMAAALWNHLAFQEAVAEEHSLWESLL